MNKGSNVVVVASFATTVHDPGGPLSSLSRPRDNHNSHSNRGVVVSSSRGDDDDDDDDDDAFFSHEHTVNPKHCASPCVCENVRASFVSLSSSSPRVTMLLDLNERFCASDGIGTKSSRTRNLRTHIAAASPLKALLLASKMSSRRFSNFAISAVDDDFDDGTSEEPPPPAGNDGAPPALLLSEPPIDLSIFFVCLFANERTNERTTTERAFWCEENEFQSLIFVTIKYLLFFCRPKNLLREKRRKSATT